MASNDEERSVNTIFTTAGQSLATRVQAGTTTVKFTKADISTTNRYNDSVTEIQILTSMDNVQQTADVSTVTIINDTTVDVQVSIDQTKAPNDYQMNSLGLYAIDGDGKEVLYSVTVLKDPVYVHQDATGSALSVGLETVVGSSDKVKIDINPAGAVTNEVFEAKLKDYPKASDVKDLIPETLPDTTKDNEFKGVNKFDVDPVDANGNAYTTGAAALTATDKAVATALTKMLNPDGSLTIGDKTFMPVIDNQNDTMTLNKRIITPADTQHVITVNDVGTAAKANFDSGTLTIDKDLEVLGTVFFYENETDVRDAFAKTHPHAQILTLSGDRPTDATSTTDTGTTTGTDTSGTTTA